MIVIEVDVIVCIEVLELVVFLKFGEIVDIIVVVYFNDGSECDVIDKVEWKINSYKVVQVIKGKVKVVGLGKVKVIVKYGSKFVIVVIDVDILKYL